MGYREMDGNTEGPWPCKSFSFCTANLLPWVRYRLPRGCWPLLLLSGSCHGTGRGVSTQAESRRGCCWLDCDCHTLLSCDSICSAFRARKGHDAVLACSEQPAAFWGLRRWTSEMCQAEKGSQTECQWEQKREEEHVWERQKKECSKWHKGREGSEQKQGKDLWQWQEIFSIYERIQEGKKRLKSQCLEFSEKMPSFLWKWQSSEQVAKPDQKSYHCHCSLNWLLRTSC